MSDLQIHSTATVDPEFSREMIGALGVTTSDSVTVIGRSQINLLIELCRVGVSNASCSSSDAPSGAIDVPASVVLLPTIVNETELRAILSGIAHTLRADGSLVMRTSRHVPESRLAHWRLLLRSYGFALFEYTERLSDGTMLMFAHKRLSTVQSKAA